MSEKHSIGYKYTNHGNKVQFFVESDYDEQFARNLAVNLKYAMRKGDKAAVIANLLENHLADYTGNRITYSHTPVDHSIYVVDLDIGRVELWDKTGSLFKTQWSIEDYITNRYKL